jgi:hypothetical protein
MVTAESELELMLRVAALADYATPFAVGATATLGIAEFFGEVRRPVESVAAESGLDPAALRLLLRALVARRLFSEPEPGTFALVAESRLLLDAHPWSLRSAYELLPADVCAWGHAEYSLRTGQSAFEHAHGQSLWQYLSEHSEAGAQFDRSMEGLSRLEMVWLRDAYDWTRFGTLVDVGGGNGAMLVALLTTFPTLRGVLFDLPPVIARAVALVEAAGLAERCQLESGDFFAHVPTGYDAYILKRIVYNYDDVDAARILHRVRAGMRQNSRVLLVEPVRRKGGGFDYGKLLDMQMLILGGGRVRDRQALRGLLETAGLRLRRIIPTPMAAIVEALPE